MISEENSMENRTRLSASEARMRQLRMIYRNRTRSSSDIYSIQTKNQDEGSNLLKSFQNQDIQIDSTQDSPIKSHQRNIPK